MNTPIHELLQTYAAGSPLRLHMPGGKGKPYPYDITEINGADSLYEASGIILESERNAARLFGSGDTLYSCGGSTLCIQTMLALAREITGKTRIAAGRFSHKSLINACALLGLKIDRLYPGDFLRADISPEAIESAVTPDTAAVFINSVDYYGGEADIAAASEICKKRGVLLLVDNAHGAYKVFTGDHPITLGADMTADSAHKTLPALTGAAYLHLKDAALRDKAKKAMPLFGSSSPSYLIMDSLDLCNVFISEKKEAALSVMNDIALLKETLVSYGYTLLKSDKMRVTIDAAAYGYTGDAFADELRKSDAECEMSDERYVVLLFSAAQDKADLSRLTEILRGIPKRPPVKISPHKLLRPEIVLPPREALFSRKKTVKTKDAAGLVCAETASPCPPCVPLVMPGERIDADCIAELLRYGVNEILCVDILP